jgi:hypothetical protein
MAQAGRAGTLTQAQIDAAAAVLWGKERWFHREVAYLDAEDDEREPYQRMARMMLEAAAAA